MLAETGADLSLRDALAAALEANRQLVELTGKLREENARWTVPDLVDTRS